MDVEFLGQPLSENDQVGRLITGALVDAAELHVVIAWAQVSGLEQIADSVRELRSREGSASAVLGIDNGIATQEGLALAVELFDPVFVFHDSGSRNFHPKLYCVQRAGETIVVVGSSNLSGGGLFDNYEANVVLRLDVQNADDLRVYRAVQRFWDSFKTNLSCCKPLTTDLIAQLASEEALVTSELRRERRERTSGARAARLARAIFGPPPSGLPRRPRVVRQQRRARQTPMLVTASTAAPVDRWWKQLKRSDVLRKPDNSHQRNYVALTQARHNINRNTWFRRQLFGSLEWSEQRMRSGHIKEVALAPFDVVVEGRSLGRYDLLVDHAEGRIANQNNSPTYLNWSSLIDVIRESDFRGWWLELARLEDGTLRLVLQRERPV